MTPQRLTDKTMSTLKRLLTNGGKVQHQTLAKFSHMDSPKFRTLLIMTLMTPDSLLRRQLLRIKMISTTLNNNGEFNKKKRPMPGEESHTPLLERSLVLRLEMDH